VARDLRVHAQALDAQALQYRENAVREVDATVEMLAGDWAAFEVKPGANQVDAAAASLLRLAGRVDSSAGAKARSRISFQPSTDLTMLRAVCDMGPSAAEIQPGPPWRRRPVAGSGLERACRLSNML
jgi:hypothetical protein